jgi:superfamily II DNA/RNA helicase
MPLTRDELAARYLEQLPYSPYPVQEEALLAWFTAEQGVLVCAPTGTGKTLIAEAALFEALHTGSVAYYTTPLIALTEQKFREMQEAAVRWGFREQDIGLVTGNRRVNPDARVLVVVAEILLNRLLHTAPAGFSTPTEPALSEGGAGGETTHHASFDFSRVSAVVMDEFHSFADVERGIVWELTLSLLPPHVRLLLLSATVGNAHEFVNWLDTRHGRKVELVESRDRRVPLTYQYVPDQFLGEFLVDVSKGDAAARRTPALVFCFNRDECWSVAEQLKGLPLVGADVRDELHRAVNHIQWSQGVGPKLKQMLHRGVGVHHAGLLPKYRRVTEELFNKKLLSVCVCTETLAAGINLPARSVVLTSLVKGPFGKEKLIEASTAHQIFGRAGRPQFDDRGYVYAIAHEDDVRILRWKEQYDRIPEDTKDPNLIRAKKALKRKRPTRSEGKVYWNESGFKHLQSAPPGRLYSKGPLPWRLLAYLLTISPEVERVRRVIRKRLLDEGRIRAGEKQLDQMLITMASMGYITLEPTPPPRHSAGISSSNSDRAPTSGQQDGGPTPSARSGAEEEPYHPVLASPTPNLAKLLVFRSIHPLYGGFLLDHLGIASDIERLQMLESVLEMPRPILRNVRVPYPEDLPAGPLEKTRLDPELIQRGLIAAPVEDEGEDEEDDWGKPEEHTPTLADKLRLYFDALHPEVWGLLTQSVWCANELLALGGVFNKYIQSRDLLKQEGIIFRHLLRLILLTGEFAQVTPAETTADEWQGYLRDLAARLTDSCRDVDPSSTDELIEQAKHSADVVEGEASAG